LFAGFESLPLKVTLAAVSALVAFVTTATLMVHVWPCGSVLSPQARRIELANASDCEQKPLGEVVMD
jgi:hypothetical protein